MFIQLDMEKTFRHILLLVVFHSFFWHERGFSFTTNTYSVGLGYYSMNANGKTTSSATGSANAMGTTFFPFFFGYFYEVSASFFVVPQIQYSLMPRSGEDGVKSSIMKLDLPLGGNIGQGPDFDWQFGPSIEMYTVKGPGGTKVLNNGSSTSTFARPGRSVTARTLSFKSGLGYTIQSWRTSFDIYWAAALSEKRSISYLLSVGYLW